METPDRERLSRFSDESLIGPDGKPIQIKRPKGGALEIIKALGRRRFLNCEWLAALTGLHPGYVVDCVNVLKRKPSKWVKLADQILEEQREWLLMPLFYELDTKGIAYLEQAGLFLPERFPMKNLQHQAMTDQIMASLEIGVMEDSNMRLIPWPEIRERKSLTTHKLKVSYRYKNNTIKKEVSADDRPVGIERTISGKTSYVFLYGPETDCATEPLYSYDYERSYIFGKLMAYLSIIENKQYRELGLNNLFFPFFAPTQTRMEGMMRMLDKITDSKGSPNILFATHPLLYGPQKAEPSGRVLTQAYKRVGHSDLYLNK